MTEPIEKINAMKNITLMLTAAAMLAGCGSADEPASAPSPTPAPQVATSCSDLRDDVIRTAATNGVTIVKIYEPKTIKSGPAGSSCSGRAVISTGQAAKIYYRNFKDEDGDWLVQYAEQPFEPVP